MDLKELSLELPSIAESTGTVWLVKPSRSTGWANLRAEPSLESDGLARSTLDQEVIVVKA